MRETIAGARAIVERRHADLHDPLSERLLEDNDNPTVYQFGYLRRSEQLCFWERERILLARALETVKVAFVPGQAFFPDGSGANTIRLSFSNSDEDTIREGIRRLGDVLRA